MVTSPKSEIRLVVDGIVYGFQRHGGINTMFNQLLPRLAVMPGVRVAILVPPQAAGTLPPWPVARLRRNCFPGKTGLSWKLDNLLARINQVTRDWRVRLRPWSVFHSTYFTCTDARTPQVATVFDMNHEKFVDLYQGDWGRRLRKQYREHVARGTRVVAISQATKNDAVHYYGLDPNRIDVVHLAADTRDYWHDPDPSRLPAGLRTATSILPYILFVGLRSGYKNFRRFLKAFASSSFRNDGRLAVVGGGMNSQDSQEIDKLGLDAHVVSIVYPTNDQLRALYSCAAAFVFPSFGEGFGVPVLESMACGAPTLLSDIPVFHEIGGAAAVYFDPFDYQDMARCIDSCADPAKRNLFSEAGFRQAAGFSWDNSARQMVAVYRKTLEEMAR